MKGDNGRIQQLRKAKESINKINGLRRETNKAREERWKEKCEDLEEIDRKGRSDLLNNKGRQIKNKTKEVKEKVLF